ncbi:MAG: transglutaminase-like domain-containing protein [Bacteroidota bacterium]|nr:transglutaminase-like domain-containing protein [Bacteroidota bacterium]
MNTRIYSLLAFLLILCISCNNDHLINDSDYLDKVNTKFLERKEMFSDKEKELFSVFERDLSIEETQALKFLYAYMPLSDIADYTGSFFLDNIRLSLRVREQTDWGDIIPENIFLHYVLPPRVNNENLDSFRIAYYDEIITRINNCKSIEEAALEINHWCHEKVTYQPADIRTSAPMSTVLSARGRCGEESTLTVAALRTAGIPARQIYTPRWAHSDDNHAWVEVWVNGNWKYMGACEPEPVLNRGWFTEPARRAMLTHTKALGLYRGDESLVKKQQNYAEINTLSNYARTKTIYIKVFDANQDAVDGALVQPRLYNYAEFYPLAEIQTGENGLCRFETGLGDLIIWAHKGKRFGFKKVTVAETDTVIIPLGTHEDIKDYYEFDLKPPFKHKPFADTLSEKLKSLNAERLKKEDSIRQAYIDTWMDEQEAVDIAVSLDLDTGRVKDIINRSMGNYKEISRLIRTVSDEYSDMLADMLEVLSDKDLRDTRAAVLEDHLLNAKYRSDEYPEKIFTEYVLNPRIAFEIITPWRSYIQSYFEEKQADDFINNPHLLAEWIAENIKTADGMNYYNVPVSPQGVLKTAYADMLSRKILFIACCRTFGIPARLEYGTGIIQFYHEGEWNDVYFDGNENHDIEDAYLSFSYERGIPVPEYYIHFTLAKFENGRYITLDYDYNKEISSFDDYLSLPEGKYMLVTGNRTDESTVLSSAKFFDLESGERKTIEVELRKQMKPAGVLGEIDLNQFFEHENMQEKLSDYSDKGMVIVWIDHDKEPSKHILNDIPLAKFTICLKVTE